MNTSPKAVRFDEDSMWVSLADGRTLSVPLAWFPRLLNASGADRQKWQTCAAGYGIHWETLDEDLSTEGLLRGTPSFEYVAKH